jgi:hypothetical protein
MLARDNVLIGDGHLRGTTWATEWQPLRYGPDPDYGLEPQPAAGPRPRRAGEPKWPTPRRMRQATIVVTMATDADAVISANAVISIALDEREGPEVEFKRDLPGSTDAHVKRVIKQSQRSRMGRGNATFRHFQRLRGNSSPLSPMR